MTGCCPHVRLISMLQMRERKHENITSLRPLHVCRHHHRTSSLPRHGLLESTSNEAKCNAQKRTAFSNSAFCLHSHKHARHSRVPICMTPDWPFHCTVFVFLSMMREFLLCTASVSVRTDVNRCHHRCHIIVCTTLPNGQPETLSAERIKYQ